LKDFEYVPPTNLLLSLLRYRNESASTVMAGGTYLLHALKQGNLKVTVPATTPGGQEGHVQPTVILALPRTYSGTGPDLRKIVQVTTGGQGWLRIGAMARLADIAKNRDVKNRFRALAQAAGRVGSPLIRNMGTIGGNLCQDVWCWYFRGSDEQFPCCRRGGDECFAEDGDSRYYHAIYDAFTWTSSSGVARECYAVNPSDLAVSLMALNAKYVTVRANPSGNLPVMGNPLDMDRLFIGKSPGHSLARGQIIAYVQLPEQPPLPGQWVNSAFVKMAMRTSPDFAVVSAAAWVQARNVGSMIQVINARIAVGGVAWKPVLAPNATVSYLKSLTIPSIFPAKAIRGVGANMLGLPSQNGLLISPTQPLDNKYKKHVAATLVDRAIGLALS
jgi:CO/xanthine dehydrogenase FAD-binding subunit